MRNFPGWPGFGITITAAPNGEALGWIIPNSSSSASCSLTTANSCGLIRRLRSYGARPSHSSCSRMGAGSRCSLSLSVNLSSCLMTVSYSAANWSVNLARNSSVQKVSPSVVFSLTNPSRRATSFCEAASFPFASVTKSCNW